jgi:membrane fusion protein (multidrug efflux system)
LQAQANVDKTEASIRQKHITTPFAGQLGIRQVDLGQYITPGKTAIVSLQSMDPLFLHFYLPEQLSGKLRIDQGITFSVEQYPNVLFKGKITAINSRIDTNTHTLQVQATLPNCPAEAMRDLAHSRLITVSREPHGHIPVITCDTRLNEQNKVKHFTFIPGMFASIDIEQPSIPGAIVLPTSSISYSLYGNSVFIIEKDKQPDTNGQAVLRVKRVFVSTGDQKGNYTVIKKGVAAGQLVAASGELKLQNGTRVTINNDVQLKTIGNPDQLGQ